MAKELTANVYIDGVLYEAGTTPPKEVADQISNPKVWAESEEPKAPAKKAASRKSSNN